VKEIHHEDYFVYYDGFPKTVSLCRYFWTVVSCVPLLPFVIDWRGLPQTIQRHSDTARALIVWGFISYIIGGLLLFVFDVYPWWSPIAMFFIGIGLLLTGLGIVTLVQIIADKISDRPKKEHETIHLVKEFASARKHEVCPCIHFID